MTKLFLKIFDFFEKRRAWMWGLMLGTTVIMAVLATQLKLHTDITSFVPDGAEQGGSKEVLTNLKIKDRIIILFSADDETVFPDDLIECADAFETKLWQQTDSAHIMCFDTHVNLSMIDNTIDFIYNHLPIYLDSADYMALDSILQPNRCAERMAENYSNLLSPMSVGVQDIILRDPFGLGERTLVKLHDFNQFDGYAIYDDRLFSDDFKTLFTFVDSQDGSNASPLNDELTTAIETALEQVNDQFRGVAAECYGVPLIATYNARQIQRDLMVTLNIALLVIIVLILLAFKRKRTILLLIVPVIYGALFAAACVYLIQGQISAIAIGTGAVVLGVALSYSVHIISHAEHSTNARQIISELTYPLTIGSITTIGAFVGLQFTSSPLLQDFGLFAALCLIGTTLFCLLFLPHFITVDGQQTKRRTMRIIDRINSYAYDKNRWLVIGLILVTVVALFKCDDVRFNYDMMKLNYRPPHLESAGRRLQSRPDEDMSVLLVSHNTNAEKAATDYAATKAILQAACDSQKVQKYMSAADFLPTSEVQNARIERWNAFWTPAKRNEVGAIVRTTAQQAGFAPDAFDDFLKNLETQYIPCDLLTECLQKPLVFSTLVEQSDSTTQLLTQVWLPDTQKADVYAQVAETATIIDQSYFIGQIARSINDDFNLILWISSLLIFAVLLISYGHIELATLAFLPMFISWFIILGFMAVCGIEFNIVNIILSTFIFGIGDDFSIFVLDGLRSEYRDGHKLLSAHKNAIFFSSLMTIIGMGALLFAKHPAVYSLALVSLLGILVVVFVSYILQPLLFRWLITSPVAKGNWPITLRELLRTVCAFGLFLIFCLIVQVLIVVLLIISSSMRWKRRAMRRIIRIFVYGVQHSIPNVKNVVFRNGETFEKPAIIIANHQSILDLSTIIGLTPNLVVIGKPRVWYSPFFGWAVRLAGYMHSEFGVERIERTVAQRIAEGCSILIFPEGTRSPDCRVQRFHKGAFHLAEKFKLDILPIVIYGNGMILSKRQPFLVKPGISVVQVLPRIAYNDPKFGLTYQERSKNCRTYIRQQYDILCDRYNTPDNAWFRTAWRNLYLYKETSIETKMRNHAHRNGYFADLDRQIPRTAKVVQLDCGYAPEALMLALLSHRRTIVGIDSDEEKTAFCSRCTVPNATFVCADTLSCPLPPADIYLVPKGNEALHQRCRQVGLTVILYD